MQIYETNVVKQPSAIRHHSIVVRVGDGALTKIQEAEMQVAELKMLRFSLGVTRMHTIRNEYIRGIAQVGRFGEETREAILIWYGHVHRKYDECIGRRMLMMELPGKRKRES